MQVINDTVVKETICDALKFFATVKNNVSIGTKNINSPVKDANIGYIFILRFIFFKFITKIYKKPKMISTKFQ